MPSKASNSKTKSSSSRSLKPAPSLLPLAGKKAAQAKRGKKPKVHKAKDVDLRDQLNGEDTSLRRALCAKEEPKGPIVVKNQAPKELAERGSDLAKAMDDLEMAFKVPCALKQKTAVGRWWHQLRYFD
ncbi:hypothetical protein JCM11491_001963 [Sporobolomyces phaffii]